MHTQCSEVAQEGWGILGPFCPGIFKHLSREVQAAGRATDKGESTGEHPDPGNPN